MTIEYWEPVQWDITLPAGATFTEYITLQDSLGTPIPLSTWTGEMEFRRRYKDVTPLLTLTDGNGLTLEEDGKVYINMTHEQTSLLGSTKEREVVTALELTSPTGFRVRVFDGTWTVTPEATRSE